MKSLKTLLLSLSVLFVGTTANAQEKPAQQQHAQKILELQKQIEKLVKEQVQQQMKNSKAQFFQKKIQGKNEGGQTSTSSSSSGMMTIVGPDGKTKTFRFNPGNANVFPMGAVGMREHFQIPEFMIGIAMDEIPKGFHELIGIEPDEGVIINLVMEGTPAEKAGLKKNDLILKLNGKKVTSPEQVQETIKLARGNKMKLKIRRGKENLEVELTPEKTKKSENGNGQFNEFDIQGIHLGYDGDENVGFPITATLPEQLLVGPGMIMKVGSQNQEMEALKKQVKELSEQQAEMKELLESVKELISEKK